MYPSLSHTSFEFLFLFLHSQIIQTVTAAEPCPLSAILFVAIPSPPDVLPQSDPVYLFHSNRVPTHLPSHFDTNLTNGSISWPNKGKTCDPRSSNIFQNSRVRSLSSNMSAFWGDSCELDKDAFDKRSTGNATNSTDETQVRFYFSSCKNVGRVKRIS